MFAPHVISPVRKNESELTKRLKLKSELTNQLESAYKEGSISSDTRTISVSSSDSSEIPSLKMPTQSDDVFTAKGTNMNMFVPENSIIPLEARSYININPSSPRSPRRTKVSAEDRWKKQVEGELYDKKVYVDGGKSRKQLRKSNKRKRSMRTTKKRRIPRRK